MVQMGQGFASMSAPSKYLLKIVTDGTMATAGHPVLRAEAAVTAAKVDAADNIKPDKAVSGGRIDGIVGLFMALDGLTRRGRGERRSVWEDR
jgi:phage terminase large subunit-like protein